MTTPSLQADGQGIQATTIRQLHQEQLKRVERFNGRAAMLGFAIALVVEAFTGFGILDQIGLASLLSQG
jgi:hypothetical protein